MKALMQALQAFQDEVVFIKAKRSNDFTKSKFAKLVDVMLEIREPLKKHGLVVDQTLEYENGDNLLRTDIIHLETGETKTARTKLVNSSEILKWGASVTYQRRYAQLVALGLITDGDDDGELQDAKDKPAKENLAEARLKVAQMFKDRGVTVFKNQLDQIQQIIGKQKLETVEDALKVIDWLESEPA